MKTNFTKRGNRWTKDVPVRLPQQTRFVLRLTVHDSGGVPDERSVREFDAFLKEFEFYLDQAIDRIGHINPRISKRKLKNSMKDEIFVFIPGTIDSQTYRLMLLIDVATASVEEQSFILCFEGRKLVFFDNKS